MREARWGIRALLRGGRGGGEGLVGRSGATVSVDGVGRALSGKRAMILVLLGPETIAGWASPVPVAFWALAAAATPGGAPA